VVQFLDPLLTCVATWVSAHTLENWQL